MNEIGNKDFKNEVTDIYTNPERFKEVRDDLGKSQLEQSIMDVYTNKMNSISEAAKIDMVNHPQHYKTGKIECIDCISAVVNMYDGEQAYDVGQVIKYLYRAPTKQNFMQDLKKAQWYLNRLIKIASKQNK